MPGLGYEEAEDVYLGQAEKLERLSGGDQTPRMRGEASRHRETLRTRNLEFFRYIFPEFKRLWSKGAKTVSKAVPTAPDPKEKLPPGPVGGC